MTLHPSLSVPYGTRYSIAIDVAVVAQVPKTLSLLRYGPGVTLECSSCLMSQYVATLFFNATVIATHTELLEPQQKRMPSVVNEISSVFFI